MAPQDTPPGERPDPASYVPPPPSRFVGGANVPARWGLWPRMNGTWPFGLLEIRDGRVVVRLAPLPWLGWSLDAAPADLTAVFPVGPFPGRGLGFRTHDGREWYFWTSRETASRHLAMLAWLGFPVHYEQVRPLYFRVARRR